MVVGGGRESHTREKGVPFAGGTNLLRMDSLRTCAGAIIFCEAQELAFRSPHDDETAESQSI